MPEKPLALVKAAFELRAMCVAGYQPQLEECVVCGCEPEEPRFLLGEGALHCVSCRNQLEEGVSMPLTGEGLQALRYLAHCDAKRLFAFDLKGVHLRQLAHLTEAYLLTQLERGFYTLDFYKSVSLEE